MGFVMNRPTSHTVAQVLAGHFELPELNDLVFAGGPVETSALFILHNSPYLDMNEKPVIPGVYIGNSNDVFERVVQSAASGNDDIAYQVFLGCSGWAPGQLAGEILRGDWIQVPATGSDVFDQDPCEIWDREMQKQRHERGILPSSGFNPSMN